MADIEVLVITGGPEEWVSPVPAPLQIGVTYSLSTLTKGNSKKRSPCSAPTGRVSRHCNAT